MGLNFFLDELQFYVLTVFHAEYAEIAELDVDECKMSTSNSATSAYSA